MKKTILLALTTTALTLLAAPVAAKEASTKEVMSKSATYSDYSKTSFAKAKANKRVLFFHANWCSKCKSADKDIKKNLKMLPKDAAVFKVDYDEATALKKQYGVTMQHTFVWVDNKGKAVKKWAGGKTKDMIKQLSKGM